jgi:hypothetical protein
MQHIIEALVKDIAEQLRPMVARHGPRRDGRHGI